MKKITYLILLILIGIEGLFAQSQTDSLLFLLKKVKGTEKVDVLNDLAVKTRNLSLNQAFEYAEQALQLSKQINYKYGEGVGHQNKGIIYYFQRKYPLAIKEYELAYDLFDELDDRSKISAILNNRAIISVIQGEYEKALNDYNEAVAVNIELENWKSVANIYNNIGMVYSKWGNNEKTIEYYNKSLKISLQEDNKVGIAAAYNNIALVKKSLGNYDQALDYYQKAIKVNEEVRDLAGLARCLSNMSSIYIEIGDNDKALSLIKESLEYEKKLNNDQGVLLSYGKIGYLQSRMGDYYGAIESYKNSIEVARSRNDQEQIAASYRNIGLVYEKLNNYIKAIEYHKNSLEQSQEIKNIRSIALAYYNLGKCYSKIKNNNKAIKFLKQSISLSEEHDFITLLEDSYKSLSQIYIDVDDYENAISFQTKYIEIHELIYNEENQKRITELQTKYETEKKEKEILQLKTEKQKNKQRNLVIAIISTFLTLLILVLLFYSRYLIKKKSIKLLDRKNEMLRKTNIELKEAKEKAEESDRLKTAFLANVSHEIRTPLNAIIGFSEFLIDPELEEEQKLELLNTINLSSDMLLGIIDDILDIARIESGQLRIKKEKISLSKLMNETYLLMKDKKDNRHENVHFRYIENNGDIELFADSFRIKQVLMNLIDNAFKFTHAGEVSFEYKKILKEDKEYILFEVTDTGIGIDDKFQKNIFEMFYKVPRDKSVIYRGTGIGLSIVKSVVEQMDGEVSFHSEKNKGSKFSFIIPYIK